MGSGGAGMRDIIEYREGRIITRNADGGTTAWAAKDAIDLHARLGCILHHLGLISMPAPPNPIPAPAGDAGTTTQPGDEDA